MLERHGARYRGWLPNARAPEVFARHLATVHVPRRFYVEKLPGIPTIRVFDMVDGRPVNGRVFVDMDPGISDGIRTDRDGNLWAAAGRGGAGFDGVHCYASDGTLLGRIHLPEVCANFCFGGVKKNRLFITAQSSLYAVYVNSAPAAPE